MTSVHSYTICHYGSDYLGYALQSVFNQVDRMHVIYTPHPSHGYQTDIPPIETKEQIVQSISPAYLWDKVKWHEMTNVYQEGQQRDMALQVCKDNGADIVLVVDCDEVWDEDTLSEALSFVAGPKASRNNLVNMTHLWRSFNWCCRDNGWPVRIIDLTADNDDTVYIDKSLGEVYHFGYAVRDEIMHYKWKIHGHKGELRQGWLDNEWQAWPPVENCHPTNGRNEAGEGFWNPEPFDKEQLPEFMREHPFWGLEKIE